MVEMTFDVKGGVDIGSGDSGEKRVGTTEPHWHRSPGTSGMSGSKKNISTVTIDSDR
jgi:hypothetical protein